MFDDPYCIASDGQGWIEVITGSMFSGKTEELMRRLRRASFANKKVKVFKPLIDNRYDAEFVVSHDANHIPCVQISSVSQILSNSLDAQVIGIDEAQFFKDDLPSVCRQLADSGVRVIVAGLDMDFMGRPFGSMPELMAIAEYVSKVHAVCACCGATAYYSHRITASDNLIVLGEKDQYEPLCRACYCRKTIKNKVRI